MKEKYVRDVETDLYYALKVMDHSDIDTRHFGEYSHIFRFTNEPLDSLEKYFKDKKKILSVTCSGDQVLNFIAKDGKDIETFDISIFPKYFLDMKLAACKKLSKEEFFNMFYNPDFILMDLDHLYEKFNEELPMASRYFWDGLFSKHSWSEIYSSDLFTCYHSLYGWSANDHGLGWNKHAERCFDYRLPLGSIDYNKLQKKASGAKVDSITCDISKIAEKTDDSYDLIFLSNIVDYVPVKKFKNYINNLKVNENGIILSTFGYVNHVNKMADYQVLLDDGFERDKTGKLCQVLVKKF